MLDIENNKLIIPKEEDRETTYESIRGTGKEFVDKNNTNNLFWLDKITGIAYPQKTFNSKLNTFDSPELISSFEDFNLMKKSQNSKDGSEIKTLDNKATIILNDTYDIASYWMIADQTLSGEPLTDTLKIATIFEMKHKNVLRALYAIITLREKRGKNTISSGDIIEARYVNRASPANVVQKRHKYYILSKDIFMRLVMRLPNSEFKDGISDTLVDFFTNYQDAITINIRRIEQEEKFDEEKQVQNKLARAVKYHYLNVRKDSIKNVKDIAYSKVNRAIYSAMGIPKRFRSKCKGHFTPELRNQLAYLQGVIINKLYGTTEYDLTNYDTIQRMIKTELETMQYFLPNILDKSITHLDKLMEAGIIKRIPKKSDKK
jgi:phage regulator Rha-like protein